MIVDFHSHTTNSDGSLSTAELTASMEHRGVSVFSITDHDTTRAYAELPPLTAKVIAGIEINTSHDGADVHILGYGFDPLGETEIARQLEINRAARRERVVSMVRRLNAAGYPITEAMIAAEAGTSDAPGRPHVAKALVRAGMVRDVATVFRDLLGTGCPAYVPSSHVTPREAIASIAKSGGVPVLAHPGRLADDGLVDELIQSGLRGMEVFYPTHSPALVAYYRAKAARFGLVMTGGSDFHDARWNGSAVGVEIDERDIRPFLELVG